MVMSVNMWSSVSGEMRSFWKLVAGRLRLTKKISLVIWPKTPRRFFANVSISIFAFGGRKFPSVTLGNPQKYFPTADTREAKTHRSCRARSLLFGGGGDGKYLRSWQCQCGDEIGRGFGLRTNSFDRAWRKIQRSQSRDCWS